MATRPRLREADEQTRAGQRHPALASPKLAFFENRIAPGLPRTRRPQQQSDEGRQRGTRTPKGDEDAKGGRDAKGGDAKGGRKFLLRSDAKGGRKFLLRLAAVWRRL